MFGFGSKKSVAPDGQMELVEHLAELRSRIFRSIGFVALGMLVAYFLYTPIYRLVIYPIEPILRHAGWQTVIHSIQDAFLLKLQTCFIAGLVFAFPLVVLEIWGFVQPALTAEEQRPVRFLAPFSVLLFLAGVGTAYASLPSAYGWMASYVQDIPGATLLQDARQYLLLTVKILLAFGVAFQLPIVLLFLARVGVITAEIMVRYWRYAIVLVATTAAILTPSNDPLTMMMMAVPMAGLYLLSIGLVRIFEPRRDGSPAASLSALILVASVPVAILSVVGYWLWRSAPVNVGPPPHVVARVASPAPTASPRPTPLPTATPVPALEAMRQQIDEQKKELARLRAEFEALRRARKPAGP